MAVVGEFAREPSRYGQRVARRVVAAAGGPLPAGSVVHHVDRNQRHNAVVNLWVFASQADHASYHRGGEGRPVWRGDGGPLNWDKSDEDGTV